MAKKPETRDHFNLMVNRLTPQQLGEAIAMLAKIDITDVRPELVTEVRTFKQKPEIKSQDVLVDWIGEKLANGEVSFGAIEVVNYFKSLGRTGTTAYPALGALVAKGILRKIGPGMYGMTAVKHLPAPEKKAAKKVVKMDRHEVSHLDFLLKVARRNHSRFNTAWMKKQFTADKRKWGAVSPAIANLIKLKKVKRVGDGEYILPQEAVPKKKGVAKRSNGAGVSAAESTVVEVTHG